MTEQDKKTVQQSLRDAWMSVLGVIGPEGEIARTAHRVLDVVSGGRARAEAAAEPSPPGEAAPSAARDPAAAERAAAEERSGPVDELLRRVRRNRESLERRVDEAVKAAVTRVRNPIAAELAALRGRLEALQARIEERRRARRSGNDPAS